MRRLASLIIVILLIVISVGSLNQKSAAAQTSTWTQQARLMPSDLDITKSPEFGRTVVLSKDGTVALITDLHNTRPGAYVYLWNAGKWSEHQRLDCVSSCISGYYAANEGAISADKNYILLGKRGEVFVRNGDRWQYQTTLLNLGQEDVFSMAFSVDGSSVLVGLASENSFVGAALLYIRNGSNWTLQKRFENPSPSNRGSFGFAVALSENGSVALISATGKGSTMSGQGWAYFFIRNGETWSVEQEITSSYSPPYDPVYFGWSVDLSSDGTTAAIGTPADFRIDGRSPYGSVYIFVRTNNVWVEQQRLIPIKNHANNDLFGGSVSISDDGNIVAIGSDATLNFGPSRKAAYIFARNGISWTQEKEIVDSDYADGDGDRFGISISISGDGSLVLVGADMRIVQSEFAGTAYIFSRQSAAPPPLFPDHPGVYHNGVFHLRNSNTSGAADMSVHFGGDPSDLPIAGDWNGDGISTIGVYRSSTGTFFLSDSNTAPNVRYAFTFGNPGDAPLAGHWDEEITRDSVGVYRNSNGILYLKDYLSTGFSDYYAVFGNPGDVGIAGDWNGDGYDSVGVYRPSNQTWYLSNNHTPSGITFGDVSFVRDIGAGQPITGDWNADSTTTTGNYVATSSGIFELCGNNSIPANCNTFTFGMTGGKAISGYWNVPSRPPSPVYGILQPAAPPINHSTGNVDGGSPD